MVKPMSDKEYIDTLHDELKLLRAVAEAAENLRCWYYDNLGGDDAIALMKQLAEALKAAKDGGAL